MTNLMKINEPSSLSYNNKNDDNFPLFSLILIFFVSLLTSVAYITLINGLQNNQYFAVYTIGYFIMNFLVWVSFAFIFFYNSKTDIEWELIRRSIFIILLVSLMSAYVSTISERLFTLLFGFSNSNDGEIIAYYVYLVPTVEEFCKFFPIFFLFRNYIRIKDNAGHSVYKFIISKRQLLIYSIVIGAFFDLFKHFQTYSMISDSKFFVNFIFLRSISPIMAVTSLIFSLGANYILFNYRDAERDQKTNKNKWLYIGGFFIIVSIMIHSLWNYADVSFSPNSELIFEVVISLLFLIFCFILIKKPVICSKCKLEHAFGLCPSELSDNMLYNKILSHKQVYSNDYAIASNFILCPNCGLQTFDGQVCYSCGSWPKIQCSNCNQVVSVFANRCWSCGMPIPSLFDKMHSSSPSFYASLAVGVSRLIGTGILISVIISIINLDNSPMELGFEILLLIIFIVFSTTIFWYFLEKRRMTSIFISIIVTSSIFFVVVIQSIFFAVLSLISIFNFTKLLFGIAVLVSSLSLLFLSFVYFRGIIRGESLIISSD